MHSNLQPPRFEIPLRRLRAEATLFRPANISLLSEEQRLINQYSKIIGSQTVQWQGQETTLTRLQTVYQNPDRTLREHAWRLAAARQLADREAINDLWQRFFKLRQQLATRADLSNYRTYRWVKLGRFDYTPGDCAHFHEAIEAVVVPAAQRIYEKRRRRIGVETLRPWDLDVDPSGLPLPPPFQDTNELQAKASIIFHQIDPQLGAYFDTMAQEGLLDLDNRKN